MKKISSMQTDSDTPITPSAPKNLYSGSFMSNTMKNYLDSAKYANPFTAVEPPNPESLMVKQQISDLYNKGCEPFEVKPEERRVPQTTKATNKRQSFDRSLQSSLEMQTDEAAVRNSRIFQRKLN